jgi:hypothetical protein
MRGYARNGNPELPFSAKENLPPTKHPRLKNGLAEEGRLEELASKKHRVEHSALGQAKPQATIKISPFIAPKNRFRLPQSPPLGEKG